MLLLWILLIFSLIVKINTDGQRKKGSMILLSLAGLHFAAVTVAAWCGTNVMLRKPFLCMSSVHSVIARQAKAEPFV